MISPEVSEYLSQVVPDINDELNSSFNIKKKSGLNVNTLKSISIPNNKQIIPSVLCTCNGDIKHLCSLCKEYYNEIKIQHRKDNKRYRESKKNLKNTGIKLSRKKRGLNRIYLQKYKKCSLYIERLKRINISSKKSRNKKKNN